MSHRRPATAADKHVERMLKAHPGLLGVEGVVDTFSPECVSAWMRLQPTAGMAQAELARRTNEDPSFLLMEDVALWSRWRTCRHVYRFDHELSAELVRGGLPDSMPTEALRLLPYPVVYVDAPFYTAGRLARDDRRVTGFFAWLDVGIRTGATTLSESAEMLMLMMVHDGGEPRTVMAASLEEPTLGGVVRDIVSADMAEIAHLRNSGAVVRVADDYEAITRQRLSAMFAHLLYVVADNSDQEVEYRPSGKSRRKGRCESTIHAVGTRVGRAIGAAKVRYVGGGGAEGDRTVRPHVRAAHWHHYWTGPRSEPEKRELVLRWVMPTFVNGGTDAVTVTHEASRK